MAKYFYPRLSPNDFGFFRLSGPGLANCMFFAANAYLASVKKNGKFIEPTWFKFSIGPWIRRERDKRFYSRIFRNYGIGGARKAVILLLWKMGLINLEVFSGLGSYFSSLNSDCELVRDYFKRITKRSTLEKLYKVNFNNTIAVHVRLGDYSPNMRVPLEWYRSVIQNISNISPSLKFLIFSDGTDDELQILTQLPNVKRAFFGDAYTDMLAISRCKLLIASDSTFSAWAAFLGNVPIIFNKRHFPPVYSDDTPEYVIADSSEIPDEICKLLCVQN